MAGPGHFLCGDLLGSRARPRGGGVDFREGKFCREKLGDHFFSLDHKQPESLTMLFFAEGAQALNRGLRQHD